MIFKIQKHVKREGVSDKHGRIDVPVVPYENWVFEAPRARYTKVKILDWREFNVRTKDYSTLTVIGEGPPCACGFNERCEKCTKRFDKWLEFIELILMDGDRVDTVVAIESSLYIMNDQGKTVDSVYCHGD